MRIEQNESDGLHLIMTASDALALLLDLNWIDGALSLPLPPTVAGIVRELAGHLANELSPPSPIMLKSLGGSHGALGEDLVIEALGLGIVTLEDWQRLSDRLPEEWRDRHQEPPSLKLRERLDSVAEALAYRMRHYVGGAFGG